MSSHGITNSDGENKLTNFREARIPYKHLCDNQDIRGVVDGHVKKAEFYKSDEIVRIREFETKDVIFRQEITRESLIFKKFNWNYEYPWQKIKRQTSEDPNKPRNDHVRKL